MIPVASSLTYDQQKAAEAAFHGRPLNPNWTEKALEIYFGILAITKGKDIVTEAEQSAQAIAA
jgi:hypothetical protein